MKKTGISTAVFGTVFNFALFLVKLYIGISSNSLTVYCDAINNLGDAFACLVALIGFIIASKLDERRSSRAQSLCTFVISTVIAVTGCYFVYNGLERIMYPLPVSYSAQYALVIGITVGAKVLMGLVYIIMNKKQPSPVLKALILDSFLDCAITVCSLMSLFLITKINFAADGVFAVITGLAVTVSAVKNIVRESKYLING